MKTIHTDFRINITADMHTHSNHSHDGKSTLLSMAEAQRTAGTGIFAVTDHCDIAPDGSMAVLDPILQSFADADEACAQTGVEILHGVEIGEAFWDPALAEKVLSAGVFDAVIGSVHAVRFREHTDSYSQIDFSAFGKQKSEEYFDCYLGDLTYMAESADFDILAHLTCPLRYINGRYGLCVDCRDYEDKIKKILGIIIQKEIALEVNTSCLRSAYDSLMPEAWVISEYLKLGGKLITLGSDAHKAESASHCFDKAKSTLSSLGVTELCYYKNREAYIYRL